MAKSPKSKTSPTALTVDTAGKSYDELRKLAERQGTKVKETPIVDKDELVGVPFIITGVAIREGDHGPYCQVAFLTADGEVGKFSDGSTGVLAQLDPSQNEGAPLRLPIDVPGGLRVSRYQYEDPKTGKETPAATFYLSGRTPFKALGTDKRKAG